MMRRLSALLLWCVIAFLLACAPIPTTTVQRVPQSATTITASATIALTSELNPTPLATPSPTPIQTSGVPEPPTAPTSPEHGVSAQVLRVIDGHTIEVSINGETYKVRYIGIDTPESKHPEKSVESRGQEAAAKNEELVGGQVVELEKDVSETDQYGRLLRYVWVGDVMVNAELVRQGYAQVSTYPPDVKYVDLFQQLEQEARGAGRGLWGPVLPPLSLPLGTLIPPSVPSSPASAHIRIAQVDKRAEFVDIRNNGDQPQELYGWVLVSEKGDQQCTLGGVINPGETLRIWALTRDQGQGGYNCGFGENIWNDSEPDPAVLYDAAWQQIDRYP